MQGGVRQDLPFRRLRCKTRAPEGSSLGVLPASPSRENEKKTAQEGHFELFSFPFFSFILFTKENVILYFFGWAHNGLLAMPRRPSRGNWRSTARMERIAHGNGCYFVSRHVTTFTLRCRPLFLMLRMVQVTQAWSEAWATGGSFSHALAQTPLLSAAWLFEREASPIEHVFLSSLFPHELVVHRESSHLAPTLVFGHPGPVLQPSPELRGRV